MSQRHEHHASAPRVVKALQRPRAGSRPCSGNRAHHKPAVDQHFTVKDHCPRVRGGSAASSVPPRLGRLTPPRGHLLPPTRHSSFGGLSRLVCSWPPPRTRPEAGRGEFISIVMRIVIRSGADRRCVSEDPAGLLRPATSFGWMMIFSHRSSAAGGVGGGCRSPHRLTPLGRPAPLISAPSAHQTRPAPFGAGPPVGWPRLTPRHGRSARSAGTLPHAASPPRPFLPSSQCKT